MSYKCWIIFLACHFVLFELSKQQIINNPIISDKEFNEVDYILILQNDTIKTTSQSLTIKKDFVKLFYQSYIFTNSLFLCKDESNNYFLVVKDKYYKLQLSSEKEIGKVLSQKNLNPDNKYLGYIACIGSSKKYLSKTITLCSTTLNEIIIYGNSGNKIVLYSLKENKYYFISAVNIGELISCKLYQDTIYACISSINTKIMISILAFTCQTSTKKMELLYYKEVVIFNGYQNPILYDTSNIKYKILCATKDINDIQCTAVYFNIIYSPTMQTDIKVNFYTLKSSYQLLFSFSEDNCNFTTYNSEYLICCGKKDIISCERRDINFNIINNFDINLSGKNSNLTLENNDDNIELIFSNQKNNEIKIYEYFIYPPNCKNIQITINAYQTFKINFSDIFERKTNTNYYISFDNLPNDFLTLLINDVVIENENKILIDENLNYLNLICQDNIEVKNYIFYFNIYIEETYSNKSQIFQI